MNSETIRAEGRAFAELGTIEVHGSRFTALGAVEHDDGTLTAYVRGDVVGSWDGSTSFGRVIGHRDYRAGCRDATGRPARMRSLRVRRVDGVVMVGQYGPDWRDLVRLRPVK